MRLIFSKNHPKKGLLQEAIVTVDWEVVCWNYMSRGWL